VQRCLATLAAERGRFSDALNLIDSTLSGLPKKSEDFYYYTLAALRSLIAFETGDQKLQNETVERWFNDTLQEIPPSYPIVLAARICGRSVDQAVIEDDLMKAKNQGPPYTFAAHGLNMKCRLAQWNNDIEEIDNCLEELNTYDTFLLNIGIGFPNPDTFFLRGELLRALGRLDEAAQFFNRSLSKCRQIGYVCRSVWSALEYADTLQRIEGHTQQVKSTLDWAVSWAKKTQDAGRTLCDSEF
jgi:tetratricopeptide (TPR) repeat protein